MGQDKAQVVVVVRFIHPIHLLMASQLAAVALQVVIDAMV
jgi:hypothetical protein